MSRHRRTVSRSVVGLALAPLLLVGCATSSPEARLADRLNDVIAQANGQDASGLRSAVESFLGEVESQSRAGVLPSSKVSRLQAIAREVFADADLIDDGVQADVSASASAKAAAEASRSAAAAASAEASRSAAAEAEASRSAAASPTPDPEPTDEPKPEKTKDQGGIIPTGAGFTGGGSGGGATPTPAPTP